MSQFVIEINEDILREKISEILNTVLVDELRSKYTSTGREISYAVSDLIKANDEKIIDRAVEIAAAKIARKALPKLIEKLDGDGE